MKRRGESVVDEVSTPPLPSDGYYQLRVTAAALGLSTASSPAEETAAASTALYLKVVGGELTEIDANEYLADSNANREHLP